MVDAAPAVQALAGFRNGTESSNSSRSAPQSESAEKSAWIALEIARNGLQDVRLHVPRIPSLRIHFLPVDVYRSRSAGRT